MPPGPAGTLSFAEELALLDKDDSGAKAEAEAEAVRARALEFRPDASARCWRKGPPPPLPRLPRMRTKPRILVETALPPPSWTKSVAAMRTL